MILGHTAVAKVVYNHPYSELYISPAAAVGAVDD